MGLRMILDFQEDMRVVAEAADGEEALAHIREHGPDVVVMDIRMPRLDGLAVIERLASNGLQKFVVLTTFDDDDYLLRAIRAGASGFLLKDIPRAQLVQAIRVAAAGDELISPAITRRLVETLASARPSSRSQARTMLLSDRERQVLKLLGRASEQPRDRRVLGPG